MAPYMKYNAVPNDGTRPTADAQAVTRTQGPGAARDARRSRLMASPTF
jgi:hypothetical protein